MIFHASDQENGREKKKKKKDKKWQINFCRPSVNTNVIMEV